MTEDGALDASFGVAGVAAVDFPAVDGNDFDLPLSVTSDGLGRVIVSALVQATSYWDSGPSAGDGLVALTPHGAVDTSFGEQGFVIAHWSDGHALPDASGSLVVRSPTGLVTISGATLANEQDTDASAVRFAGYDSQGALSPAFGGEESSYLAQTPTGIGVMHGWPSDEGLMFSAVDGRSTRQWHIGRVTWDGAVDASFGTSGLTTGEFREVPDMTQDVWDSVTNEEDIIIGALAQPTFFCGEWPRCPGTAAISLARISSTTGELDSTFGQGGTSYIVLPSLTRILTSITGVGIGADRSIYVAISYLNGPGFGDEVCDPRGYSWAIVKVSANGALETAWQDNGVLKMPGHLQFDFAAPSGVVGIVTRSDGRLLITAPRSLPNGRRECLGTTVIAP